MSELPLDPAGVTDWDAFVEDAEAHQLLPLAHASLQQRRATVPDRVMRQLDMLTLRYRAWHRARTVALIEILQTLERLSIEALVLKGAALAWTVYAEPTQRPMSDLDLLVRAADAPLAQAALAQIGFRVDAAVSSPRRPSHHLPLVTRQAGALPINVEIHVDALSRDSLSSIAICDLSEPPDAFRLDGYHARTLGPVDMLRHLTHHLLEPSWTGTVRLVGVVDLLRYAAAHHDRIDWPRLARAEPLVVNMISCLHLVVPLPAQLIHLAPPPLAVPDRVGETMMPLRAILRRGRPAAALLGELFNPPAWWLHARYGVALDRSLVGVRFGRHPWRLARWAGLRLSDR